MPLDAHDFKCPLGEISKCLIWEVHGRYSCGEQKVAFLARKLLFLIASERLAKNLSIALAENGEFQNTSIERHHARSNARCCPIMRAPRSRRLPVEFNQHTAASRVCLDRCFRSLAISARFAAIFPAFRDQVPSPSVSHFDRWHFGRNLERGTGRWNPLPALLLEAVHRTNLGRHHWLPVFIS
jgi:hypothetical protein